MWDPDEFGNMTDIIVKADKLWLPELAVMNGYASTALEYQCHVKVLCRKEQDVFMKLSATINLPQTSFLF